MISAALLVSSKRTISYYLTTCFPSVAAESLNSHVIGANEDLLMNLTVDDLDLADQVLNDELNKTPLDQQPSLFCDDFLREENKLNGNIQQSVVTKETYFISPTGFSCR